MKHIVTKLEGTIELIQFTHSILGNYFLEIEVVNYIVEESIYEIDEHSIAPRLMKMKIVL